MTTTTRVRIASVLLSMTTLVILTGCGKKEQTMSKPISNPPGALALLDKQEITGKQVRMETSKGTVVFELYGDDAPIAVSNFVTLVKKNFYNNLTFHRYEPGFVIQGGDPMGTGLGGPGYSFIDEPVARDYTVGTVAMANAGPNTNGSQFFIMLDNNSTLPKNYTIFGKVTKGMEVVMELRKGDTMTKVNVEPLGT